MKVDEAVNTFANADGTDAGTRKLQRSVRITESTFLPMETLLNNAASQRRLFALLGALSMLLISMPVVNGTTPRYKPAEDATFEKVWVEHDVKVDGKKGMRIHAKFKVKNSLNVPCTLIAQFYKRDGAYLKADGNPAYTTSDGHVFALVNVKPSFSSTAYADKRLFIPYEAFNLKTPGVYLLKFVLFVNRYAQGSDVQSIGHSADFNFTYTKTKE